MALKVHPPQPAPFLACKSDPYSGVPALIGFSDGVAEGIRTASHDIESFSIETGLDLTDLTITDYGDLIRESTDDEGLAREAGEVCRTLLSTFSTPIFLAESQTITPGTVRACLNRYPNLAVVQINAHANLNNLWEGKKWHERCAMKQVIDRVHPENLFSLGLRSASKAEFAQFNRDPANLKNQKVYLSFDFSIFDHAYLPTLRRPIPGGLDWLGVIALLDQIPWKNLIACDLVGLTKEPSPLAAMLLREILVKIPRD